MVAQHRDLKRVALGQEACQASIALASQRWEAMVGATCWSPSCPEVAKHACPRLKGPLDYALSPVGLFPRARARRITSPRVSRWSEHACNHEGIAS